jgi:hypothetical protein
LTQTEQTIIHNYNIYNNMKWNKMSEKHWESQSTWCEGQQLKQHANGRYIETVDKVKRMEDVELKNQIYIKDEVDFYNANVYI